MSRARIRAGNLADLLVAEGDVLKEDDVVALCA